MTTTYKVRVNAEIYVETDTDDVMEAIRIACKQLPLRHDHDWTSSEIEVEVLDDDIALDEIPSDEIVYTEGCDGA